MCVYRRSRLDVFFRCDLRDLVLEKKEICVILSSLLLELSAVTLKKLIQIFSPSCRVLITDGSDKLTTPGGNDQSEERQGSGEDVE
jgi:hypothetical protein